MRTEKLGDLFHLHVASSRDTRDYADGPVPFVTSAETNNGVVRHVRPADGDRVFRGPCVVISGLGFATVHTGTVLPKGNGGDSCTVLYARKPLSLSTYIAFAAAFNLLHQWRFSYGRKCGEGRLAGLEIPWPLPAVDGAWEAQKQVCQGALTALENALHKEAAAGGPETWGEGE
jgi:hypothetical protein